MKSIRMALQEKLGFKLGALAFFAALIIGSVYLPASCTLKPEQQQRLRSFAVPVAKILSTAAVQRGWIEPGDKIVIQEGVAIVTGDGDAESKTFQLAELGLQHALSQGFVQEGDSIELVHEDDKQLAVITRPEPVPDPAVPPVPVPPPDPAK